MNHVFERDGRMFSVNGIGTFYAAVERGWILIRVEDADVVVVTNFARLSVSG